MRLDHLLSKEEEVRVLYTVQVLRNLIKILVPMRPWETPVPIPNTTVKTWAAENTILETIWEDRWVPDPNPLKFINDLWIRDIEFAND